MVNQTVPQETKEKGRRRSAKPSATMPSPASRDDIKTLIAKRAYELYVERGYRTGCAMEDWLDAEREILSRSPLI